MRITVPILVHEQPGGDGLAAMFSVRPLFATSPIQRSDKLRRALNKLGSELYQVLQELGREPRHDLLAHWTFNPLLEETTVPLRVELGSGSYLRPFFLVGYEELGRKLFFTPSVLELHFEVLPGQTLEDRAAAVLTRHFRELEKDGAAVDVDKWALQGKARLTTLDVVLNPAALAKKPAPPRRALLFGGEEKMDGHTELRKIGRALHQLYPDDLDRAIGREREVQELSRLLASPDRRPILLVGPRKVGKTTIVHELVFQMRSRPKQRVGGNRDLWLVSPMRLISGMSFLGQWENRVLVILGHAAKTDRVLYFDDLLGLFTAGKSIASDLTVAQVLKPALQKRSVRVLAEITPEAWRVLRERDRAFADLFQIIPVNEPPEGETQRVLIHLGRTLEEQHGCVFNVDVVPAVLELHRRFARDAAFPGKAAGFMRRLAVRYAKRAISRMQALEEFRAQSGLRLAFLNDGSALSREHIMTSLSAKVVGQDHALQALADILLILKARLNDPRRPLGTLLFLGPTGVGKTETAKVLARYLFGHADRLVRFDMNEYVEGTSSGRLIGTPSEPEGLLTSAIRRQPFSVVLLDEIEKAAPEVFDVLLAVLDEGRLTDSLGRVADFTNSVIVMTSNLGVREAASRLGFVERQDRQAGDAVFIGAAEKFFRPEFFNRIDRIIPFRALEPTHLEGIAKQLLKQVFRREGLRRHECFLSISSPAMTRLIELGYDPQLGARVLKRVIERDVATPLASHLAALPPKIPLLAYLKVQNEQFKVEFQDMRPAPRTVFWPEKVATLETADQSRMLDLVHDALDRIEAELAREAPAGNVELTNMKPEQARYFACREQFKKVERLAQAVERALEPPRRGQAVRAPMSRQVPRKLVIRQFVSGNAQFERVRDAVALQVELGELEAAASVEVPDLALGALCRELALLEAMLQHPADGRPVMILLHGFTPGDAKFVFALAELFHNFVGDLWGAKAAYVLEQFAPEERLLREIFAEALPCTQAVYIEGFNLLRILQAGGNAVFVRHATGTLSMVLTQVRPVATVKEAKDRANDFLTSVKEFGIEQSGPIGSPALMITENKSITDFRSGLVIPARPSPEEFRALMLSALAPPITI